MMSPHFIADHFLFFGPDPRDHEINLRGRKTFRRIGKAFILHQIINMSFLIFVFLVNFILYYYIK